VSRSPTSVVLAPLQSRRFPSVPVVSRRFSPFLGRYASDPNQTRALRTFSCASQTRGSQNRVRVGKGNKRGVQVSCPPNMSKLGLGQIALVWGARAPHPSPILRHPDSQYHVSDNRASDVVGFCPENQSVRTFHFCSHRPRACVPFGLAKTRHTATAFCRLSNTEQGTENDSDTLKFKWQ